MFISAATTKLWRVPTLLCGRFFSLAIVACCFHCVVEDLHQFEPLLSTVFEAVRGHNKIRQRRRTVHVMQVQPVEGPPLLGPEFRERWLPRLCVERL